MFVYILFFCHIFQSWLYLIGNYLAVYPASYLNTCLLSHLEIESEACACKRWTSIHALLANVQVFSCLYIALYILPVLMPHWEAITNHCSYGHRGAILAALIPGVNIIRVLLVGLGIHKDEATVKSMSRFGDYRFGVISFVKLASSWRPSCIEASLSLSLSMITMKYDAAWRKRWYRAYFMLSNSIDLVRVAPFRWLVFPCHDHWMVHP